MGKAFLSLLIICTTIAALAEVWAIKWTKSASVDKSSMTRVKSASSRIQCGVACLEHGNCNGFCFDDVNRVCYIQDLQSSEPLPGAVSKCYKAGCPTWLGYSLTGGLCLKVVRSEKTYSEAVVTCQQNGQGHLVVMKTLSDQLTIGIFCQNEDFEPHTWVGIKGIIRPSWNVEWLDGSLLSNTSSLWGPGGPDGAAWRDCVCIGACGPCSQRDTSLYACTCDYGRPFICQVDV